MRRPNVVNVHVVTSQARYFLLFARAFGYKTVVSAHGSDILRPTATCRPHLGDILRRADAVTVVSDDLKAKVLAFPGVDGAKVHVIFNGIDCRFWRPGAMSVADDRQPPTIVAVGRLEHVKGFDVLLSAFAALRPKFPEVRLCLIGAGTLADDIRRQAATLGVADALDLPGHLDKEAIRERLRRATVFALSSRSEGMPLSLLEAMACGLPAVATRVGGVPEVVTERTGLAVAPDAPEEMAGALSRILGDPGLRERLARGAHDRAQAYSESLSHDAYERVFMAVLAR